MQKLQNALIVLVFPLLTIVNNVLLLVFYNDNGSIASALWASLSFNTVVASFIFFFWNLSKIENIAYFKLYTQKRRLVFLGFSIAFLSAIFTVVLINIPSFNHRNLIHLVTQAIAFSAVFAVYSIFSKWAIQTLKRKNTQAIELDEVKCTKDQYQAMLLNVLVGFLMIMINNIFIFVFPFQGLKLPFSVSIACSAIIFLCNLRLEKNKKNMNFIKGKFFDIHAVLCISLAIHSSVVCVFLQAFYWRILIFIISLALISFVSTLTVLYPMTRYANRMRAYLENINLL